MGKSKFDSEAALRRHFALEIEEERRAIPSLGEAPALKLGEKRQLVREFTPKRARAPLYLPAEAAAVALFFFMGALGYWSLAPSAPAFVQANVIELGLVECLAHDLGEALGEAAKEYRESPPLAGTYPGYGRFQ